MRIHVNDKDYEGDFDPNMPILWVLRDVLGFTGTKYGCGKGLCGACTILVDDQPVRSCSVPVGFAEGKRIHTIEGLENTPYRSLQMAWIKEQVPQCGYCQSGQLMNAVGLLKTNPNPTENEILDAMQGNICRCGTYPRIIKALKTVIENKEA